MTDLLQNYDVKEYIGTDQSEWAFSRFVIKQNLRLSPGIYDLFMFSYQIDHEEVLHAYQFSQMSIW